jgi:hypothetical protein
MSVLAYRGPNTDKLTVAQSHHQAALAGKNNDFGRALQKMLTGWEEYAAAHAKRYEDQIGTDYVIGPYWAEVGFAIKRLLDGDVGGWDCGSLCANISDAIEAAGMKHNGYELEE